MAGRTLAVGRLGLALFLAAGIGFADPAEARPVCGASAGLLDALRGARGQEVVAVADGAPGVRIWILANPRTAAWSIVRVKAGRACRLGGGEGFEGVALPGPGRPG